MARHVRGAGPLEGSGKTRSRPAAGPAGRAAVDSRSLYRCDDRLELAARAVRLLVTTLDAAGGCLLAREDGFLRCLAHLGTDSDPGEMRLPAAEGSPLSCLLASGTSLFVPGPSWLARAEAPPHDAPPRLLALSCRDTEGEVRAVLCASAPSARRFDEERRRLGEIVAAHAAEALLTSDLSRQLRTSERSMRQLVENALTGIGVFQDERIAYANPRMAELLGLPGEEAGSLVGRDIVEHLHPADRERMRRQHRRRMAGEPEPERFQLRLLRVDGGTTWVEVLATKIEYEDRPALLLHAVDVSARRRAEEEKEQLEARFLQAQKMEAIGRLAGGIAHDFNNLLMAISGHAELLARRLPEQHQAYVAHIRKATELAAGLTSQLLAFSRKQVLQAEVIELNDVVSATHKLLRRIIGEDVHLELRLDPASGPVRADPSLIGQVLMNLAVNARDAMPEGGSLTIETAAVEVDAAQAARSHQLVPGRYVRLSVSDTGVGMSEDVLERLFEPFFTTKERGKGTGLGLAMVYGTVSQSGGAISVESAPGRGATFRLYFPRVSESATQPPAGTRQARLPGGSEVVLVVEDAAEVRELLQSMLEGLGYRVLTAEDADSAVRVFREHAGEIALLLTDVVLPRASGKDLATRLRALQPGLRVLYSSGYLEDGSVSGPSPVEGAVLLRKPFSLEELAAAARRLLDGPPVRPRSG